jgi:DNA transposition AAA+ family ATPase
MITVKTAKPAEPPVKIIMERSDARRIRDMLSHMGYMYADGPLGNTLTELSNALDKAGIGFVMSDNPFRGESPVLKRGV